MDDPFKSHTALFTIHPYGHGMPCPYLPKRSQSPYRWRLAGIPIPHYAKQTQSTALTAKKYETNPVALHAQITYNIYRDKEISDERDNMRRVIHYMLLFAVVAGLSGCSSYHARAYEYRYRAGTMYEYNQLMDAYEAHSGNPPPLPPVSGEPAQGQWLRVPVRPEPVYVYDDYYPSRHVVVVDDPFYDDWYYGRPYIGTSFFYSPRRHYRGSGLSIGFGFGRGGYFGGPFRHRGRFGGYGIHG